MNPNLKHPPSNVSLNTSIHSNYSNPSLHSPPNNGNSTQSSLDNTTTTRLVKAHDEHGNKCINQYAVVREIGRGVHGKVKLAEDVQDQSLWAIKILDKRAKKKFQNRFAFSQSLQIQRLNTSTFDVMNNMQFEKVKREIAILKKINHQNIVGFREVIDDPEAEKIYIVLEYMGGGEVEWRQLDADPPKPCLTVPQARRIIRNVISGLEYLHHNGIIHRDIKPANLLWTEDRKTVKISDFGVSVFIDLQSTSNLAATQMELAKTAGSPAFFAPELCASIRVLEIGAAIDVWALGVTLFCLVFGRVPFIAETEFELFHVICKAPLAFPADPAIDASLQDLFHRLLDK
ncbi:kinase-like domain-containing protein, partial [Obelidium mucronatum]